jgi:hypothetical protein
VIPRESIVRGVLAFVILSSAALVANAYVTRGLSNTDATVYSGVDVPNENLNRTAIVTTAPSANNSLLVVDGEGDVEYRTAQHDTYYDVDPVPQSDSLTVVAADRLGYQECPSKPPVGQGQNEVAQ